MKKTSYKLVTELHSSEFDQYLQVGIVCLCAREPDLCSVSTTTEENRSHGQKKISNKNTPGVNNLDDIIQFSF